MNEAKRPRRSRQIRSNRRRHVLRTLRRQGVIQQELEYVKRGGAVWLHSAPMSLAKRALDDGI